MVVKINWSKMKFVSLQNMLIFFRKAWSFIKKDFIIQYSYPTGFYLSLISSLVPIVTLHFVAKLVDGTNISSLDKYGGNYFSFALIGVAFTSYFQIGIAAFSSNIRRAQMAGCLEAILSSQTGIKSIVVMSSFYSFLAAGVQLIVLFVVGALLGFDLSKINILSTILVLISSLFPIISLGILSAAGTVIYKQGEPVGWFLGIISVFISGAMFPITILPHWIQLFSLSSPITYSLDALRLSILKNYSVYMLSHQLVVLSCMSIVLFPLSLGVFKWAVEKGKRDGTLMQY